MSEDERIPGIHWLSKHSAQSVFIKEQSYLRNGVISIKVIVSYIKQYVRNKIYAFLPYLNLHCHGIVSYEMNLYDIMKMIYKIMK